MMQPTSRRDPLRFAGLAATALFAAACGAGGPVARDGDRFVVTFPDHDGAPVITAERA
jgi:hypothetical protein